MKLQAKIILPVFVLISIGLVGMSLINYSSVSKQTAETMEKVAIIALKDMEEEITFTEVSLQRVIATQKKTYIQLARFLAEYIEDRPDLTTEDFQELTRRLDISEIHICDEFGVLRAGSVPGFYGFDFNTTCLF